MRIIIGMVSEPTVTVLAIEDPEIMFEDQDDAIEASARRVIG